MRLDPGGGRLQLAGELDRSNCHYLGDACAVLSAISPRTWRVDLAAVTFCDVVGLRGLHAVRRAADTLGAEVIFTRARPFLRRLLTFAGLGGVLSNGPATDLPAYTPVGTR